MNRKHSNSNDPGNNENPKFKRFKKILFSDLRIKILCIFIAFLIYFFYQINAFGSETYTVPLDVKSSNVIMIEAGSNVPKVVEVTLTGNKSVLSNISSDNITAYVDISSKVKAGSYDFFVEVIPDDRVMQQLHPLQISVKPEKISLSVEEEMTGYVKVLPTLLGQPAHGYEQVSVTVEPTTVEVHGPKSVIENLENVQTKAIDIDGLSKSMTEKNVFLSDINSYVEVFDTIVSVTVDIKPISERKVITGLVVEYDSLDSDYSIVTKAPSMDITVKGRLLDIENLKKNDFSASANCSAIDSEGNFLVPIFVFAPENVQVVSQSIESVSVKAIRKNVDMNEDESPF
ncbi:MAG: hypothetical protein K6G00_02475 [Treponema sp.]|nr:hypothetical protein [Treponema sp.]